MFFRFHTVVIILSSLSLSQCTIIQLDATSTYISSNGLEIQWHSGAAAQWALSSLLVRIHPRGVFFKTMEWHLRDLAALGWTVASCAPSAHGLCQTGTSVYFPSTQSPEVNEALTGRCSSTKTDRVITTTPRYDTSACDVFDAQMDFIYTRDTMYSLHSPLPEWIYWTVCVLVVFLVRCLSRYILASMKSKETTIDKTRERGQQSVGGELPNACLSISASLTCTILIVSQGDSVFVTHEDMIFHWFTVFYIFSYIGLFICTRLVNKIYSYSIKDPPFYNLLAGVLQLVASRLYAGAETPYNPPLVFIITVRTFVKSRRDTDFFRALTLLLDACMLALMCVIGFGSAPQYLVALVAGANAWGDLLV